MAGLRWFGLVLSSVPSVMIGCGEGAVPIHPSTAVENPLATECRFLFDGVEVEDDQKSVRANSEHDIAVSFRLMQPDRYRRDGVSCRVSIIGQTSEGRIVKSDHFAQIAFPDPKGCVRVNFRDRVVIPDREGECEMQALIKEVTHKRHLIGCLRLNVTKPPQAAKPDHQREEETPDERAADFEKAVRLLPRPKRIRLLSSSDLGRGFTWSSFVGSIWHLDWL